MSGNVNKIIQQIKNILHAHK